MTSTSQGKTTPGRGHSLPMLPERTNHTMHIPRSHTLTFLAIGASTIAIAYSNASPWIAAFALTMGGLLAGWDLCEYYLKGHNHATNHHR